MVYYLTAPESWAWHLACIKDTLEAKQICRGLENLLTHLPAQRERAFVLLLGNYRQKHNQLCNTLGMVECDPLPWYVSTEGNIALKPQVLEILRSWQATPSTAIIVGSEITIA